MKNAHKLLFIQLVAATLLGVLSTTVLFFYTKAAIAQQETATAQTIEQILSTHITSDGKSLSRQLDKSFSFTNLQVTHADGTVLFEQSTNVANPSFAERLLTTTGWQARNQTIRNLDHGLTVRYQLNHQMLLDSAVSYAIWLFFISFAVSATTLVLLNTLQQRKFKQITTAVNVAVDRFLQQHIGTHTETRYSLPPEVSAISIALEKLAHYTEQQYAKMTADAQQIADEAYKDQVTGLANRNRFVQTYEEQIANAEAEEFGIFAITRCTELQTINQTRGFHEGDQYVKEVSDIIKRVAATYKESKLFRLNGSDFGILLPKQTPKDAENFALLLQSRFNEYQKLSELDSVAYTGLVSYQQNTALGELLATADTSISLAQTKQSNAWHLQKDPGGLDSASNSYGNQNWRNVIDDVLANNRLSLLLQTIQPAGRATQTYSEILVRFKTHEDQILPTASFLAMAEKLDKIIAIDRLIVETSLNTIKARNLQDQYFGINLSPRSVHDDQFVIWLERRLLKDANIATKLVFEVSEFGLQQNLKTSKRFIDMIHRAGSRITVEKFGVGITSFKFFRDLKPDFVKMDGSYTRHIDDDKNNQYFMRLMIDLAHRIGVGVFAESVETQEEKHMLESLFIDGSQGFYIGKPQPM